MRQVVADLVAGTGLVARERPYELIIFNPHNRGRRACSRSLASGKRYRQDRSHGHPVALSPVMTPGGENFT